MHQTNSQGQDEPWSPSSLNLPAPGEVLGGMRGVGLCANDGRLRCFIDAMAAPLPDNLSPGFSSVKSITIALLGFAP